MKHVAGYVDAAPIRLPYQGAEVIAVECSRAGAESAKERASRQALAMLAEYAKGPRTDHEMSAATGFLIQTICARRAELRRLQLIEAGEKVKGPYGILNTRWRLRAEATAHL